MSFPWSPTSTCRRLRCSCYNQKQHELLGTDIHVAHPGFFPQERLTDEGGGYFCQKYWPTGNKDFCYFLHICLSKSQKSTTFQQCCGARALWSRRFYAESETIFFVRSRLYKAAPATSFRQAKKKSLVLVSNMS